MITIEQTIIFATLVLTLILFVVGRWRYDVVALIALLIVTLFGLIPAERAFSGFSNPAVITVAAVLVLSRGLQNSGIVDLIGNQLERIRGGVTIQLAALTTIVAFLSAFMNNVGALALLLPVVIRLAHNKKISTSLLLMPLAFASLLGGMTTLIGTPPNIIVASYRAQTGAEPFGMFDFSPVGIGVALAGIFFIVLVGWRLIPVRKSESASEGLFEIENYLTEVRVPKKSGYIGKRLSEINDFAKAEINIIGLIRDSERRMNPSGLNKLRIGDILIISADAENLKKLVEAASLELVGGEEITQPGSETETESESDELTVVEVVVMQNSLMLGGTARSLNLRENYAVNLLAISRQGQVFRKRLNHVRFRNGDVLLLQSHLDRMKEVVETLGCLPLAGRDLQIGRSRKILPALGIFATALLLAAMGWVSAPVSFLAAVVFMIVTRIVSLREAYESVDWPILILLGAMIPVGEALETTGGAQLVANSMLLVADNISPIVMLVLIMVVTMFLSDIVNNAAAVVLMAPIAINVAQGIGASSDAFLISLAIGASCAFLTPIGHQSNTLVMGPGGYKFGDYWHMGLVLEIIVVAVSIPLILIFWPL
ncbi:MAG: SLC13 family permease [Anaerolineales bacterium]